MNWCLENMATRAELVEFLWYLRGQLPECRPCIKDVFEGQKIIEGRDMEKMIIDVKLAETEDLITIVENFMQTLSFGTRFSFRDQGVLDLMDEVVFREELESKKTIGLIIAYLRGTMLPYVRYRIDRSNGKTM